MKEVKCDCCGKVIRGYYPYEEITRSGIMHNYDCTIPGQVKPKAEWMLSVDCKFGWEPVEYHFCSVDCLKIYADVINNTINDAREGGSWERWWKHDEK